MQMGHRLNILKWVISHSIPRLTGTSRFPSEKCYVPVKAGHSGVCFVLKKKVRDAKQLDAVVERFHLNDIIDNHISELSGGQIQRVLLARAVISKPDIVILDEPNTYIDLRFQSQTYEMLKSINDECAVVVVGHDIDALLKNARNIVCVNHSAEQYDAKSISPETINRCFMQDKSSC